MGRLPIALYQIGAVFACACACALGVGGSACKFSNGGSGGTGASPGVGGGGGEANCPDEPQALYTIRIVPEVSAILPPDTTVGATWSAGEEPPYVLGDPSTHKTLQDGTNLVCRARPDLEEPTEIICELWTAGPADVDVTATGYEPLAETLTPIMDEVCEMPVPSERKLELLEDDGEEN